MKRFLVIIEKATGNYSDIFSLSSRVCCYGQNERPSCKEYAPGDQNALGWSQGGRAPNSKIPVISRVCCSELMQKGISPTCHSTGFASLTGELCVE